MNQTYKVCSRNLKGVWKNQNEIIFNYFHINLVAIRSYKNSTNHNISS